MLLFIARHIPIRQMAFDDTHSPKYQKFKVDRLPEIYRPEPVDYQFLLAYYKLRYCFTVEPIRRRSEQSVDSAIVCPRCGTPHSYLYNNNGVKGQFLCKICNERFNLRNFSSKPLILRCPYCGRTLEAVKDKKHFRIHKCLNLKCSYYLQNLKRVPSTATHQEHSLYKLHYLYRKFTVDFFKMRLHDLPKRALNFNFKKWYFFLT